MKKVFLLFALFMALLSAPVAVSASQLDPVILKNAVDASVKAEGTKLGEYSLVDQDGVRFNLSEYFDGKKPLVISYIYTSCPVVCPTITTEFKKAVDGAKEAFGDKFNVLTIGFDPPNDTPERLNEYARKFAGSAKGFRFASSDPETIERLLSSVGFFRVRQDDGSFDHIDMATAVKPDGTIYRQVYSLRTQPQNLALRLEELFTGKASVSSLSLVDKLKFFCYRYDPYSGKYVLDYPVFVSIFIQALIIGGIFYGVWGRRILARFRKKKEGQR
ncbi:MAG: SCO family protein [Deltaproteobacteria bacterium]|nr:SCO family protein [Deltaproteobacteria bacterium]